MLNNNTYNLSFQISIRNEFNCFENKAGKKSVFACFLLFILLTSSLCLKSQSVEYAVKASFIEKFARFTEWPKDPPGDYFVINVLGNSPFSGELEKVTKDLRIKNKLVKINYVKLSDDFASCQLLFICASEKPSLSKILATIEKNEILTVSETNGFSQRGVHVNFYIDRSETIKFEINLKAIVKSNLKMDMYLLSFGKINNPI